MKKILAVIFIIVMMLGLVACGGGQKPEDVVSSALISIQSTDLESIPKYFKEGDIGSLGDMEDDESMDNTKLIFKNLTFVVQEGTIDGDSAVVKTEITNLDMKSIMTEYMQSMMALAFSGLDESEMDKQAEETLIKLLSREDNPTVTNIVDISLTKSENEWKIEMTEELLNAIVGGLSDMGGGGDDSSDEDMLFEIQEWLTMDIWNNGFCDISHFIGDGKNSIGATMDIDFTLEQLAKAMEKKVEYDFFINGLDDTKYADVKGVWAKLSPEIDKLYGQLQASKPTASDSAYVFDLGLYSQYRAAFRDDKDELE